MNSFVIILICLFLLLAVFASNKKETLILRHPVSEEMEIIEELLAKLEEEEAKSALVESKEVMKTEIDELLDEKELLRHIEINQSEIFEPNPEELPKTLEQFDEELRALDDDILIQEEIAGSGSDSSDPLKLEDGAENIIKGLINNLLDFFETIYS